MKDTQPKVSVVIPAYNEEKSIGRVIRQVKEQDYRNICEIIVVDNASTDKTSEISKSLGAKVLLEKKKGTRYAYQKGISAASGEIIAVTNADVLLPTDWVSTLVSYFDDPEIVGVGTHIDFFNCPKYVNFGWKLIKYVGDIVVWSKITRIKERTFWGASMAVRKETFDKSGGVPNDADTNEDMLFTLKIRQYGKAPYIYDTVVFIDGRRYSFGVYKSLKNWISGIGLNSLFIIFTGNSIIKKFKDFRPEEKIAD